MLGIDIRLFRISTRRSFSISLADFRQPSFTNPFTLHRLLVQKEFFLILSRYHPSTSTSTLTMAAVSELVVIWNCCVRFFTLIYRHDIHFKYHAATHCYCDIHSIFVPRRSRDLFAFQICCCWKPDKVDTPVRRSASSEDTQSYPLVLNREFTATIKVVTLI